MEKQAIIIISWLLLIPAVAATPTISDVQVQPDVHWLGASATISAICTDPSGIASTTAYITGPTIVLPPLDMPDQNGRRTVTIDTFYLSESGTYDFTILCISAAGENTTATGSFVISTFSGNTTFVSSPAFVGETAEVDVMVRKDGIAIAPPEVVDFTVSLNGVNAPLIKSPPYDATHGWHLIVSSPGAPGSYAVSVNAQYQGAQVTTTATLDVQRVIEFTILSIDRQWIVPGQDVVVTVRANERGLPVNLQSNELSVVIGGVAITPVSITPHDGVFDIALKVPTISAGQQDLTMVFTYKGSTISDTERLTVAIPVHARFLNKDGNGVITKVTFSPNTSSSTVLQSLSDGVIDGVIPSGTYDVAVSQEDVAITFSQSVLQQFQDPIHLIRLTDDVIPGLAIRRLVSVEATFSFSNAVIELGYNGRETNKLQAYHCPDWDPDARTCTNWDRISFTLDKTNNRAVIKSSRLGAFAVGDPEALTTRFSLNKKTYAFNEPIDITGAVFNGDNAGVEGAKVTVEIVGEAIQQTVTSGRNGVFSLEIIPPQEERNFTIRVTAELAPFTSEPTEKDVSVGMTRSIYLSVPENIRLYRGDHQSAQIKVTNIGQTPLDMTMHITGIPSSFISTSELTITNLQPNEERTIDIPFTIPVDADVTLHPGKITVKGSGISEEASIPLTILDPDPTIASPTAAKTSSAPSFSLPALDFTGFATATEQAPAAILVVGVGVLVLAVMRRQKVRVTHRHEVVTVLNDIKREIKRLEEEQ